LTGVGNTTWSRVVMERAQKSMLAEIKAETLHGLEISGTNWKDFGLASYRTVAFPEFDICAEALPEQFDLILADQVWEHLLWPYKATRNVLAMLKPGGYFMVSVPFLIRLHGYPIDCSRWSELGLKHFLAECGFPLEAVQTGSWGNRGSIRASFKSWRQYVPWLHSLRNEPDFPQVVWALARKPLEPAAPPG
ncbi:MAG: methyltransferase domain-containing protein, partial [Deltaproteobacteria bacterium]|nr:methyltransferase domain-containing protein [Deltaproteobacteria bacterium]